MRLIALTSLCAALLTACMDKEDWGSDSDAALCGEPTEHPHDPTKPVWSYHGDTDGPEQWGSLPGYETCGAGSEQSPIDIERGSVETGTLGLEFKGYDTLIPLNLVNNGHSLQVNYSGTQSETDPQITYDNKTWYLTQFHGHADSEHAVDGDLTTFEWHFVHQATDGTLAVVGVMMDSGDPNANLSALLEHNPGHEMEVSCDEELSLSDVPVGGAFYHYDGSLTTPSCDQNVNWFVMDLRGTVSDEQAQEWITEFGGTTNRPVQPLNDRVVTRYP